MAANEQENNPQPLLTDKQKEQKEQEDYEKETKELMAQYVVGGKNTVGNTIKRILFKDVELVVYDIEGVPSIESMMVFVRSKKKDDIELENKFNLIKDEWGKFKSILYKTNADFSYKSRAAHAISVALVGDKNTDAANQLLKKISFEALENCKKIQNGRLSYLGGAVFLAVLITLIALRCYIFRMSNLVITNQGLVVFVYASAFSACGGLLSIAIKLKETLLETELENFKCAIYGMLRLLLSILAGFAVVVLIKSRIVFADLMSGNDNLYALMAMCYLAGFSETLIPNVLKNIEEKTEKKS